jgi:hypothetical protein
MVFAILYFWMYMGFIGYCIDEYPEEFHLESAALHSFLGPIFLYIVIVDQVKQKEG